MVSMVTHYWLTTESIDQQPGTPHDRPSYYKDASVSGLDSPFPCPSIIHEIEGTKGSRVPFCRDFKRRKRGISYPSKVKAPMQSLPSPTTPTFQKKQSTFVGANSIDNMAYLAQPVIVGSPNVVVIEDARMNLAGNIVRSSHYIPDPSSTQSSTDPHCLHPSLKSLPYPLTLPPVMNNNNNTSGADLANFEEDEDEDTEDSRSLMSAVTAESLTDNNSVLLSTSYNSCGAIGVVGSFRENVIPTSGSSLRGQGSSAANVRSQSRSPVAYHRIPVRLPYPVIPTVPSAAVAVVGGSIHNNGTTPSGSTLADRIPGSRVQVPEVTPSDTVVEKDQNASEECNVCHLDISSPSTNPQPPQAPVSPLSTSPSRQTTTTTVTSTCSSAHRYHLTCFQTSLLQPAITRTTLPKCPAPCNQHIPARCFLHVVSSEMKRKYLKSEMEVMMAMDGEDCDF